jgi:hypothetical protein
MGSEPELPRLSRRSVLMRGGGLAAGGVLMGVPLVEAGVARANGGCNESVETIVTIAAIAEALAVTTYYHGITSPAVFNKIADDNQPYLRGALSEEDQHLLALMRAGAPKPQTTYHFPPGVFGTLSGFAKTLETLENAFISAYGAAVNRFAVLNQPALAQLAARILGVEAEHRFAIRDVIGDTLPNNLVYEPAEFACVSDAATALGPFLNGSSGHTVARPMPTPAQIKAAVGPYVAH